ncbi:hypothetical protein KPP03845_106565 [Streptomyces xanthophaeus]|nr:hypothetical protein KPP03845_106565 [Streptomyces xanthophaeus]
MILSIRAGTHPHHLTVSHNPSRPQGKDRAVCPEPVYGDGSVSGYGGSGG